MAIATLSARLAAGDGTGSAVIDITGLIGYALVVVAAAVFWFYARQNKRLNRLEGQQVFWRYLVLTGVAGVAFGLGGGSDIVFGSRWTVAVRYGALLLFIVFIAFAMREVYYNSGAWSPDRQHLPGSLRRIEFGFIVAILVESLAVIALGQTGVVKVVHGVGSVLFTAYGVWFLEKVESTMQGTSLDTLARHLVPVLLAAGFVGISDLALAVGMDPVMVRSVTNVFVVIVGAFLASSTIRLQQNVAGYPVPG